MRGGGKVGLAVCLAPVLAGGALGLLAWERRTVREARVEDVSLRLERAQWLHLDGHDVSLPMPGMSELPAKGRHRLSVEVTVHNSGAKSLPFGARELGLFEGSGTRVDTPEDGETLLPAGHRLSTVVELEVPEQQAPLELRWVRGKVETGGRRLMTLRTPVETAEATRAPEAWPASAAALPRADVSTGEALYAGKFGCAACHGRPGEPSTATVGPSLAGMALRLGERGLEKDAAQYVYESLLDPNAFVASVCPHGRPCAIPSAMPAYGELLSDQQMADLVSYVVSLPEE